MFGANVENEEMSAKTYVGVANNKQIMASRNK
jgi:hypothetical protein